MLDDLIIIEFDIINKVFHRSPLGVRVKRNLQIILTNGILNTQWIPVAVCTEDDYLQVLKDLVDLLAINTRA